MPRNRFVHTNRETYTVVAIKYRKGAPVAKLGLLDRDGEEYVEFVELEIAKFENPDDLRLGQKFLMELTIEYKQMPEPEE